MTSTPSLKKPCGVVITGPTASGKTWLSEFIASRLDGEPINVDIGQIYTPLSVGTAKPDWRNKPFKCHLFDLFDNPCEFTVAAYRLLALQTVSNLFVNGKLPVFVGGSAFYIKSLFFPPKQISANVGSVEKIDLSLDTKQLWDVLVEIDSDRAQALHPNDRYRIVRALQIWQITGTKPSLYQPEFKLDFNALVIFIIPSRKILGERISKRTREMIYQEGWIEEARTFLNTKWEPFIERKGFIGYKEIFEWLRNGEKQKDLDMVVEAIIRKTFQYARRQLIFLKKLRRDLESHQQVLNNELLVKTFSDVSEKVGEESEKLSRKFCDL